jgi:hypothetical protein
MICSALSTRVNHSFDGDIVWRRQGRMLSQYEGLKRCGKRIPNGASHFFDLSMIFGSSYHGHTKLC